MKKLTYILIIFTFILSCGVTFSYLPLKVDARDDLKDNDKKVTLNILTYNKDIYNLVQLLVNDKHNIKYIVDDNFSLDRIDLEKDFKNDILEADLFIYNGFENSNLIKDINNLIDISKTNSINISRGSYQLTNNYNVDYKENLNYLLGVNEYKIALYNIKTAIQEKDFSNRNYYEERYNEISSEIDKFIIKSKEELKKYDNYVILTDSDVFDYLFRDLNLKVIKIKEIDNRKEIKEKNIIFIYNNLNTLKEIQDRYDVKCNYVGLNYSNKYNTLLENINLIVDGIKSSNNS